MGRILNQYPKRQLDEFFSGPYKIGMFHTEKRPRGRPKLDIPDDDRLDRKEVLLSRKMIRAIHEKARETSERDGRPVSFTEALRDIVGAWIERKGGQ